MITLIKNGYVLNPATGLEGKLDVLIEDDKVKEISAFIEESQAHQIIDAKGKYVMPGFIDLHVHLMS